MSEHRRLLDCVKAWPDAESGMCDPRCCRFPKSCSPYPYPEQVALGNVDLEPASSPRPTGNAPAVPTGMDEESVDLTSGVVWTDAQLAVVRDLAARTHRAETERDKLAAQVQAVEGLAEEYDAIWQEKATDPVDVMISATFHACASELRRALGTPTTGGGE